MLHNRHLIQGYLAAEATLVMWTFFSLGSRLGGKSVLTPYDIYALRLMTAALVLLPFAGSLPTGAWRDKRLWILAGLGSLLCCLLVYNGFKHAPAAHGAILLSGMQPFLISAVVWLIDRGKPTEPHAEYRSRPDWYRSDMHSHAFLHRLAGQRTSR